MVQLFQRSNSKVLGYFCLTTLTLTLISCSFPVSQSSAAQFGHFFPSEPVILLARQLIPCPLSDTTISTLVMDPRSILDVPRDADKAAITKLSARMALKHHPDKAGDGSKTKFRLVRAAYEILMRNSNKDDVQSGTGKFAGMNCEDVSCFWKTHLEQEEKYGSCKFSLNGNSSQMRRK